MPIPSIGAGPSYEAPPQELMEINQKLYDYLYMLHIRLFGASGGAGDLDSVNIASIPHSITSPTAYDHHGAGTHSGLDKATASTDASASTVSVSNNQSAVNVTSADATDLATVITLANEIKADVNTLVSNFNTAEAEIRSDVNQLVTDLNAIRTNLNNLKAVMRTANLLAT